MPYITPDFRKDIDHATNEARTPEGLGASIANPGELNYVITKIVLGYLLRKGVRYAYINEAIGAMECSKLELYRRLVAPYEDEKAGDNGDVY